MESVNNDAISVADAAYASPTGAFLRTGASPLGSCATITRDTSVTPHVLTIDFGTTDCTGADGKNRRGKIIVYYSGRYKDSGSYHYISFDNYYVNDNQLMGADTLVNIGADTSGAVSYRISANDSLNLGPGNGTVKWVSNRTRTWLAGYSTPSLLDDEYEITGSATVTRANGHVFYFKITSPLVIALDCPWVEQGTVTITPAAGSGSRTLDYGDIINCDDEATLTIGSHVYHITLR